jgi:hypothetical protein
VRDALDVDAARRDVGRDHDRVLAAPNASSAAMRSSWRRSEWMLVAGAAPRVMRGEPVGVDLALHEHQHRAPLLLLDQRREQRRLPVLRHRIDAVDDAARGTLRAADQDRDGVAQDVASELTDLGRHDRREHERLAIDRQRPQDAADVEEKPHVEHAVGLVEHEDLERANST